MSNIIYLNKFGYTEQTSLNQLVERFNYLDTNFDTITTDEICEMNLIEGVIESPESWGITLIDNEFLEINDQTSTLEIEEPDQVNMANTGRTHSGMDYAGINYTRKGNASSNSRTHREKTLWNSRVKTEPQDYERIISQQFDRHFKDE